MITTLYCKVQFVSHIDGFIHDKANTLDDKSYEKTDQRDHEEEIRSGSSDQADQADQEAAGRDDRHQAGIGLIEDLLFFDVHDQIHDTVDDRIGEDRRKVEARKEYVKTDLFITQKRQAGNITFVGKSSFPVEITDRISENIAHQAAEEKDGAGSQGQVEPDTVTGLVRCFHINAPPIQNVA